MRPNWKAVRTVTGWVFLVTGWVLLILVAVTILGVVGRMLYLALPVLSKAAGTLELLGAATMVGEVFKVLGAVGVAVGVWVAFRRMKVTESGQITERFTKAIEQLGDEKVAIRLGGIYALEKIAEESERYHWTVMEVLCAFVRERSPKRPEKPAEVRPPEAVEAGAAYGEDDVLRDPTALMDLRPKTDVQAICDVLKRRKYEREDESLWLNLSGVDLRGADLRGARLEGADLTDAHLEGASLRGGYLERAYLRDVHLERADLQGAHLEGAFLFSYRWGAHLERANLQGAHLERANLQGAHLEGAHLVDAHFDGANLQRANLKGANLLKAHHLERANLRGANLENAHLGNAHLERALLRGAHFEDAELRGANLKGAELQRAHLQRAHLEDAKLQGAKLWEAHLERAELGHANLEGADDLTQAQIDAANGDTETILPDGLTRPAHWKTDGRATL